MQMLTASELDTERRDADGADGQERVLSVE